MKLFANVLKPETSDLDFSCTSNQIFPILSFCSLLKVLLTLLAIHQVVSARQLQCEYQTYGADFWSYWPAYEECYLYSVDLSEAHKSGGHSFSGSSSEKSEATLVRFDQSNVVDFVPPEIFQEFPKLNALVIRDSNVPVVKLGLLGSEFKKLEFLAFYYSEVKTIEAGAFQELENLKHIWIMGSPIKTLKFGLFRNNLKLEIAFFYTSQISMIHPTLFDDLTHLKFVGFKYNACVNRDFGCKTCSISKSELKSGLSNCSANCRAAQECSASDRTTTPKIEIPSSTESTTIEPINLESTCEAILKNQSIEIEKISQKTAQVEKKLQENLEKSVETLNKTMATNDRVDKVVELFDAKFAKCELEKAQHVLEKKNLEEKIKNLEEKMEVMEEKLAKQCQDMEEMFKQQMADYVKKQLEEFENKFNVA
jgi:hypothetical protein